MQIKKLLKRSMKQLKASINFKNEDDVYGRLMGSIVRNRSWDAFMEGNKDRLKFFDFRDPIDPVILFGFNVKVAPNYH